MKLILQHNNQPICFINKLINFTKYIFLIKTNYLFSVVALTYDLESSLNGTEHLRKSPVTTIKVNEGFGDDKITNLAGESQYFIFLYILIKLSF